MNGPSLDQGRRGHKLLSGLLRTLLVALAAAGCATAADVRVRDEAAAAELEAEADNLFLALEAVASERELPISRRDEQRRRLSTDWLDEDGTTRRRYFLSVALYPGGLALRAHIVRETRTVDTDGQETWDELPPTDEATEEENAIIQRAYEIWSEGEGD